MNNYLLYWSLKTRRRAIVFRLEIVRNLPRIIKSSTIFASFVITPLEIFLPVWNICRKLKIHWKIEVHVEWSASVVNGPVGIHIHRRDLDLNLSLLKQSCYVFNWPNIFLNFSCCVRGVLFYSIDDFVIW